MNPPTPTTKKASIADQYKTLGLSSYGDENIIAEIDKLIHEYQVCQAYSHNVLLRIKSILEKAGI